MPSSRKEGIFFRGVRFLPGFLRTSPLDKKCYEFFHMLYTPASMNCYFQLELPSIEGDFSIDKESYFKNSFKTFHQRVVAHGCNDLQFNCCKTVSLKRYFEILVLTFNCAILWMLRSESAVRSKKEVLHQKRIIMQEVSMWGYRLEKKVILFSTPMFSLMSLV